MRRLNYQVHNRGKFGKASLQAGVKCPELTAEQLRQCYIVRIVCGGKTGLPGENGRSFVELRMRLHVNGQAMEHLDEILHNVGREVVVTPVLM